MLLSKEQLLFIESNKLCILGTGKNDGSPQISLVYYDWYGEFLYISVTSDRAKWKNAIRNPNIAILIPDGRKQLIMYGIASGITSPPERDEIIARIRARWMPPLPEGYDKEEYSQKLDAANRVVIKFTPEKVFSNE